MDRSLFVELIQQTKSILDSMQNSVQQSRERFIDKASGDFFYQMLSENIDKIDLLMDGFLNYINAASPVRERDTVKIILEEVLRKHQIQLSDKKIRVQKKYERDLPETIVPEEQLRFMLNSLLQYTIGSLTTEGSIEVSTRSLAFPGEPGAEQVLFGEDGRNVEIMITFTRFRKPGEEYMKEFGLPPPKKELDLLLRLVHDLVQRNRGRMAYEADEKKTKRMITLRFPAERRKGVFHQPIVS